MSPPDVNTEKQKRRHWPVLWLVIIAAAILIVGGMTYMNYVNDPALEGPAESEDTIQN